MKKINEEEELNKIRSLGALEKQLEEVQERIFLIDMIDRWTEEDSAYWSFYKDLEKELKNKIEGGKDE